MQPGEGAKTQSLTLYQRLLGGIQTPSIGSLTEYHLVGSQFAQSANIASPDVSCTCDPC